MSASELGGIVSRHRRSPTHAVVSALILLPAAAAIAAYGVLLQQYVLLLPSLLLVTIWLSYCHFRSRESLELYRHGLVHRGPFRTTSIPLSSMRDYLLTLHNTRLGAIEIRTSSGYTWRSGLNWQNRAVIENWVYSELVVGLPDKNRWTNAGAMGAAIGRALGEKAAGFLRR